MPTVSVGRDLLFQALGRTYTEDEFESLCAEFGIELDDVTTQKAIVRKEKHLKEDEQVSGDDEVIFKIEVPANRPDLLCLEGIAQALRIFCGDDSTPKYKLADISKESMLKMHVKPETYQIRRYVVCAVLRGITFNEARYNSFIDLLDKMHQNTCRQRTLVSIGAHDLDTIEGPFTYEVDTFQADKLMEICKSDLKLKKYLHTVQESSPIFTVIYDRNRTVLSLPPIINNGAHSAISLKTKNVFIECTATDLTKANIVLNTIVTMFSIYCERKFEIEPVEVIYDDEKKSCIYPQLCPYDMKVSLTYINSITGLSLEENEVAGLLNKMQLHVEEAVSEDKGKLTVHVPPTRSDVLHACDVAEDVAIAYGYNRLPRRNPTSVKPLRMNEFKDRIREEMAMSCYTEVLTFGLCSYKDNFTKLNRKDDKLTAVIIDNPCSTDTEVLRSSLVTGMLKVTAHNKDHPKPIKIFEVGDIVLLDESKSVGARNQLQLAALYCGVTSGLECIHGLVDKIMQVSGIPYVFPEDNTGYYIEPSYEPEFFLGRQASIICKGKRIGTFGIVNPQVLINFGIPDPCSIVELNLECLL